MLAVAAELLDQDPAELRIDNDRVVLTSDPFCYAAFDTLAEEIDRLGKSRKVVGLFDISPQFPEETRPEYLPLFVTGAQAAQVLVDMETGQVAVKRVAAAHDVGRVINPLDAVGQIPGCDCDGIGNSLNGRIPAWFIDRFHGLHLADDPGSTRHRGASG
jgi:CO/xanthine dehydrogenase Mo-binding subunit